MNEIKYYKDYISEDLLKYLLSKSTKVDGVLDLVQVGESSGLESKESFLFLTELYELVKVDLNKVLNQRMIDRLFIDQQTKACFDFNTFLKRDFSSSDYKTLIGLEDSKGRIVIGPKNEFYCKSGNGLPIAHIPDFLKGNHVTLFGPPDDTKLSINAMNAYHRKLKDEPKVIEELLKTHIGNPFWGADDEDSKTPLRKDLVSAGVNLTECFEKTISFEDEKTKKKYSLETDHLALPIKRFPGLALPSFFLFYKNNPIPLHLYDFALHLFKNWKNKSALAFYVPKLENEEEARYIKIMISHAENLIKRKHPEYVLGSIRLMIVLENPRALFRVNEIIDELFPYFVGASLGWHDYLASTARLFKEDANYRIPVKADPDIVIKYIKASHNLLAQVVGSRGGIKVGGMYGILPNTTELASDSFQITMKGFIKDVITQMKRDLTGFWVAHPDFVRIGLALVEAWKQFSEGKKENLEKLICELLDKKYHQEILGFLHGPDIEGLQITDPLYKRSLLVADIKESTFIANNHPDEIRYNVFQSLQYLTDWLSGNGCVALPADINGIAVRVMDDLATAERSRWEVWHEIHHQRFDLYEFLKIAHEEMNFIRKDLSNNKKIVQVKWNDRTQKWYPVAFNLMIRLMTDKKPVEFATELLLPFTIVSVQESLDPWSEIQKIDANKFLIDQNISRFNYYFGMCGSQKFAKKMLPNLALDLISVENTIMHFDKGDIIEAASFHGDIGEGKKTLDHMAVSEQSLVFNEEDSVKNSLAELGLKYKEKFGIKFLVSAAGKSGLELLTILKARMNNSLEIEVDNAKKELYLITAKRLNEFPMNHLTEKFSKVLKKHNVIGASISLCTGIDLIQNISLGESEKDVKTVNSDTWFEIASLSKTIGSCFAIEYFKNKNISLDSSVNQLFQLAKSDFRIASLDPNHLEWGDEVTINHLMSHCALNMHYVNGVPLNKPMPRIQDFLKGNELYQYPPIGVINKPGTKFQYSGGGFLVLEYLLEVLEGKSFVDMTKIFLKDLGLNQLSFNQEAITGINYAHGYTAEGTEVIDSRKKFPSIAAGGLGTSGDLSIFLNHLCKAFHQKNGSSVIGHDTARLMLHGRDLGSRNFMGAFMGLGVFIAEAGLNKLAIHQGANDGFRCLYIYCFEGPNLGYGLSILCNGELNGVLFNSEIAQEILHEFKFNGIDTLLFKTNFEIKNIPTEEIVNYGYKNLLFNSFLPALPEKIIEVGELDSLSNYNLVIDAKVVEVSNQKFARAENLFSKFTPVFDPDLFGVQGKIMDSWETVRHNFHEYDYLIFNLTKSSIINFVSLSTKYHLGNQVQFVQIEGLNEKNEWIEILPKNELSGHSLKCIKLDESSVSFKTIKVKVYPDGGLSRLGLYSKLPESEIKNFKSLKDSSSIKFQDEIAKTLKPLAAPYAPNANEVTINLSAFQLGEEYDVANLAFGGKMLKASNEHYGPAIQTISPFSPMHMFDGFESARSRSIGHKEDVLLELARPSVIHRIELNFSFFINNNPSGISIFGLCKGEWIELVGKTTVKAFAGNSKEFKISNQNVFEQIKVYVHPDGGINRIRVFSYK